MTPEEAVRTMEATLTRVGLAQTALRVGSTVSRLPDARSGASALPNIFLEGVAEGGLTGAAEHHADLITRGELGRGGMGVVYLAQQRSVGRDVAVKTMIRKDGLSARALVREAQILGALEHPNMVPLHALGVDRDGTPVLVMKRVEGASWGALLRDPRHEGWKPLLSGHGDLLRANIEVLSQVCRALAFAHERGVVHRDLKPDNVLIGRFGEVYLVDWGVALRLSERATEAHSIVGTPGYLAPEMARADPRLIDARTDVYLLGGVLYELLTGRMPHEAPTALAALAAALMGQPPSFPDGVPSELATLARLAMARDQEARVSSAEAFREGLAQYLVSREVDVIVSEARASFERARSVLAAEGPGSVNAFRTLIEARFGLASARRMRPTDAKIAAQLDDSVQALVEREVALRSPGAARAFLAELANPRASLVASVEALEAELGRERRASDELARKRREADATAMVRPLSRALVLGWAVLVPFGLWNAWRSVESGHGFQPRSAVTFDCVLLGVLGVIFFALRKMLFATAGTARVSVAFLFWAGGMVASDLVALALGAGTNDATLHSETTGLVLSGMATATVIRELWPAVLVAIATVCGVLIAPDLSPVFAILNATIAIPLCARAFRLHAARSRAAEDPHSTD